MCIVPPFICFETNLHKHLNTVVVYNCYEYSLLYAFTKKKSLILSLGSVGLA